MKCLFTLQKKANRLICNADSLAHTNAMFKDMSTLKLSEFVKYKTAIVMFNLFHGILPIQLQRRSSKYSSVPSTRQKKVICDGSSTHLPKGDVPFRIWCEVMERPS